MTVDHIFCLLCRRVAVGVVTLSVAPTGLIRWHRPPGRQYNYWKIRIKLRVFRVLMGIMHRFHWYICVSKPVRNLKLVNETSLHL